MKVEVWSDIACPWCYVGKRRLEAALRTYEHRAEVTVQWRAFELDLAAPAERPTSQRDHLAAKYGHTPERAQELLDQLAGHAEQDGLDLRFDRVRGANTFDAHRMVALGGAHGVQDEVKERLMQAYFTEGELVSDHASLARLAAEAGVPEDEAAETLAGDRFAAEVRADEALAYELGVQGVPFFVVDRRVAAAGAHPAASLVELLSEARAARSSSGMG